MASGRAASRFDKPSYFCCKSEANKPRVCLTCGRAYHENCMLQDGTDRWAMMLDETRMICYRCEVGFVMTKGLIDLSTDGINLVEVILRTVVKEVLEKNRILSQSNKMLSENLAEEKRKTAQLRAAVLHSSDVGAEPTPEAPRISTAISDRIAEIMKHTPTIDIKPNPPILTEYAVNAVIVEEPQRYNNAPSAEGETVETNQIKCNPPIPLQHNNNVAMVPKKPETNSTNQSKSNLPKPKVINSNQPSPNNKKNLVVPKKLPNQPKINNLEQKRSNWISHRPAPMRGTNRNHYNLKLATKPSWIFVSGFDPNTREDDIMHFLKGHDLDEGCQCHKMYTKKDQIKSSFKLGVPAEKMPQVMATHLWPTGVLINNFQNLPVMPQQYRYPLGFQRYYGYPYK